MSYSDEDLCRYFADSLEKWRVEHDMSQKKMASSLHISLSTYKRMINLETHSITLPLIRRIYDLTGNLIFALASDKSEDDVFLSNVRMMTGLSDHQLIDIHHHIVFEIQSKPAIEEDLNEDDFIDVYVPTGNMEDGMIYDSRNIEKLNISGYRKIYGNRIHCGIKITSNNLHPVYHIGDILLVTHSAPRHGDTGIFLNRENGCMYIRKYLQGDVVRLEPIVNYGSTFEIDPTNQEGMEKWIKFGYVVTKLK